MSDVGGAALPTPAQVAAHLESLNLTGMGFAAKRLLGRDPMPVVGQFAMWGRAGKQGLPSLTQPLWDALAPLGISRPTVPAAARCDQVLVGAESDAAAALQAADECASAGKTLFGNAQLTFQPRDIRADALRQKALVSSIKDYWRSLGALYGELRRPVAVGDLDGALAMVAEQQDVLRKAAEDIGRMAAGVAGVTATEEAGDTAVLPGDSAFPDGFVEPALVGATVESEPTLEGPPAIDLVEARAEAFAQARPLHEVDDEGVLEDEDGAPVEVLSTKPVRNHPFLPIIFLVIVSAVALYTLLAIINDPTNPLAQ